MGTKKGTLSFSQENVPFIPISDRGFCADYSIAA